jgi:hypothetical protein
VADYVTGTGAGTGRPPPEGANVVYALDRILWLAFKIAGVTFGSLLGVFLLGLVTRVRANRANVAAMVVMAIVNLVLLVLAETRVIALGWSWLVILGTAGTMILAPLLAPLLDRRA